MTKRLIAFAVRKTKDGKQVWTRAGLAHVADDRTINVQLDVLPLDGAIQLRQESAARGECWIERVRLADRYRILVTGDGEKPEVLYDEPTEAVKTAEARARVVETLFALLANISIRRGCDIASEWLREVDS